MFSIIPMDIIWNTNEVPPAEKKGRGIPVGGTDEVATPMFKSTCTMVKEIRPNTNNME